MDFLLITLNPIFCFTSLTITIILGVDNLLLLQRTDSFAQNTFFIFFPLRLFKKLMTTYAGMEECKNINTTTMRKMQKKIVNKTLLFTIGIKKEEKKCRLYEI